MSIEKLDIFALRYILAYLPDVSCYRLGIVLPQHKTEINNDFKRKLEINIDGVSSEDANDLLEVIKCCSDLRKVNATKERTGMNFERVIRTIVQYCPMLEELNIPGINLSGEEAQSLSFCKNLNSLNIRYTSVACTFLADIYRNNFKLEKVRLHVPLSDTSFTTLPSSIKEIEIANVLNSKSLNAFIDNSTYWALQKLSLPNIMLNEKHLSKLKSQNMLRSLNVTFSANINFIQALLVNNSYLEDVTLSSNKEMWTTNVLNRLPNTIKRLKLENLWCLDSNALQRLLKIWKMESLCLNCHFVDNIECIPELIRAAPTLKELSINGKVIPRKSASIEIFKQLKSLKLLNIQSKEIKATAVVIENCVDLEVLHLETLHLNENSNLFVTIANLPKLLKFQLTDYSDKYSKYYKKLMTDLARSESLKTVRIRTLQEFSKETAEIFKNCKTLQHFEYQGRNTFMDLI